MYYDETCAKCKGEGWINDEITLTSEFCTWCDGTGNDYSNLKPTCSLWDVLIAMHSLNLTQAQTRVWQNRYKQVKEMTVDLGDYAPDFDYLVRQYGLYLYYRFTPSAKSAGQMVAGWEDALKQIVVEFDD